LISLNRFHKLTYSEDDWQLMESAHRRACDLLGQSPLYYEHNDRLARTIMKLFDTGTRNVELLASIAVHREHVMDRLLSTHH
jgi:hypothetical protein